MVSFVEYSVLFPAVFFAENNSKFLVESFLTCFGKKIWPKLHILLGLYTYKNSPFLENLVFFPAVFAQNNYIVLVESFSVCFWEKKKHFTQTSHFAWAIELQKWSIFKMVSFLEYSVFLQAFFCTQQLYCSYRIIFGMFLKKNVKIKLPTLHGW